MDAVKWMREGKKVRREGWHSEGYAILPKKEYPYAPIEYKNFALEGDEVRLEDYEATDWEIIEQQKPFVLVEKVMKYLTTERCDMLRKGHKEILAIRWDTFEEFIQKVKEDMRNSTYPYSYDMVDKIIQKRAGKL